MVCMGVCPLTSELRSAPAIAGITTICASSLQHHDCGLSRLSAAVALGRINLPASSSPPFDGAVEYVVVILLL